MPGKTEPAACATPCNKIGKNWFGSDGSTLGKILALAPIFGIKIEKSVSGASNS